MSPGESFDAPRAQRSGRPRTLAAWTWLLALGLLGIYLPTLATGATFTDGPEITVAIHRLGVIHPTGYPLFTLLGHLFTRLLALPIPVVVKVELLNALCGIGSALLIARSTSRLVRHLELERGGLDRRRADRAGLLAGTFVGVCPLLWSQIRIPEVYPFQMLLVCAAGYCWLRFELSQQRGWVVLAALPMGMGLAHHVTMVYMLPAALVYLLVRDPLFFGAWLMLPVARLGRRWRPDFMARRRFAGWWAFPVACLVGFLPMLTYGYLIWANAHTDGVPWGDVRDWTTLWDHATGKQYQGFLKLKELAAYGKRIAKLPVVFDEQFLPMGTVLFFSGIAVAVRRNWRFSLFLLSYLLFNVAHGVYYAVGDYGNYFLPALLPCALLVGVGCHWLWDWAERVAPERRLAAAWLALLVLLGGTALGVTFYAKRTNRIADALEPTVLRFVALPLGALALALLVLGLVPWLRRRIPARPLRATTLPSLLTLGVLTVLLGVAAVRGRELGRRPMVGKSWGQEVVSTVPRGAIFMTQGDGFLFTMWHEHHVLERGLDFATLDMGNLKTPWYQRYLRGRYPLACDPLARGFERDPDAYERLCGSFRRRMSQPQAATWGSIGLQRTSTRPAPAPVEHPFIRGNEPPCEDAAYRKEHGDVECRCYDYGKRAGVVDEDCVVSTEEGGITAREPIEVLAHRIIEDVIQERPIYERNMYTRWLADPEQNKRKWAGPAYLRPPGQYDLLNRGRLSQIVHHADLVPFADPCAAEQAERVALRPLRPARSGAPPARVRERYEPNDRPTLLVATYLTPHAEANDDDASRRFGPGDAVHVQVEWLEQFRYDPSKPGRRGAPIHEGVRFCFFDPDGHRLVVQTAVSGDKAPPLALRTRTDAKLGAYLLQACSVGEVGERRPPFDELPCQRILLEYEFRVEAGAHD